MTQAQARFAKTEHGTQWIPVKNLSVVWRQSQRDLDDKWSKQIADAFDPEYFGTITVCKANGSGMFHIIDGQHRRNAVADLFGENECVPCAVFDVNDPKRAAEIFDRMNTQRKPPGTVAAFKVRVTAGHEVEVAVNKVIRSAGYRVEQSRADGTIRAVGACVYAFNRNGPVALRQALEALSAIWDKNTDAVDGSLIRGFSALYGEHSTELDTKRLVDRISKKFTPGKLLSAAKLAREMLQTNLSDSVAEVVKRAYNEGLRSGRLGKS